jgi:uracil-DNA glycosylase
LTSEPAALARVLREARACTLCAQRLPLGPRPVLRAKAAARLLIVGQAPGTRVHETGIPWNDASGDRLRGWMGLTRETFYDDKLIAIVPIGFCYPGRNEKGGDRPPIPECAPLWHPRIVPQLAQVRLTLLVGTYAQRFYLGPEGGKTVAETVGRWRDFLPRFLPLPHPSWRTKAWEHARPWFARDLLPELRARIRRLIL